ncbi:sensor histidine kinase [Sphingomonas sp. SUN039]|uniref:sensor histidine kinase n=1 Tax=Sphingomonas sp. SUN039 TaxID=2937787 RepID=UPI00216474B4|nr:histidine kinase [Sphingomonas sp. SUN039]UVO55328.1 histidine kinase [Sphingomonas sp. SUN039]
MRRLARLTLLLTLWWSAVAAIYSEMLLPMARVARPDLDLGRALFANWMGWLVWVPVSLVTIAAVGRNPFEREKLVPALATAGGCILIAIFARAVFVYRVNDIVPLWYLAKPAFLAVLLDSARNNLILASLVVGTAHALHYSRANTESRFQIAVLETGLARARLDALSAQLNPHFLFNALNTIAETLHDDPQTADAMIVSLASLLRQSLDRHGEHLIPLSDEVALMSHYLSLQKMRLGRRLSVDIDIADGCSTAHVPPLILQPLAENAIVHGIGRQLDGGRVRLEADVQAERLRLRLTSDGALMFDSAGAVGIGLSNVRERLTALFGDRAELTIGTIAGGQTQVVIIQPLTAAALP